jgi:hypothetical protein
VGRFGKKKMEMFASGRHEPFSIYQNFLVSCPHPPVITAGHHTDTGACFLCSGKLASWGGGILVAVNLDRWSESISAAKLLKVLVCKASQLCQKTKKQKKKEKENPAFYPIIFL